MLNLHEYCITNELTINTTKTRVMVCSRGKIRNKPTFTYGVNKLEIVFEYMYLGVKVTYNGKFKDHMEYASLKGTKSMFALLQKAKMLNMPVDIQCHLFDTLVSPVLPYGCEVWGSNDISIIEKIQLKFMKYILHVNKSTSSNMIYRELGRMPLHITVTIRILMYWARIVRNRKTSKFNIMSYLLLLHLLNRNTYVSPWIKMVKDTLENLGFGHVWNTHQVDSIELFKINITQRLHDQYRQKLDAAIVQSSKCSFYSSLTNDNFALANYLTVLPFKRRICLTKFKLSNHRLPIELLRYAGINKELRTCTKCNNNEIGDEIHYLLNCSYFQKYRKSYIGKYLSKPPTINNVIYMFNSCDFHILSDLSKFTHRIMSEIA